MTQGPSSAPDAALPEPQGTTVSGAVTATGFDGLRRATIVGAGRMGLGIAESFVVAGLDVTLVESSA